MRVRSREPATLEDTWVGRAMFPQGVLKNLTTKTLDAPIELAHSVDTVLVFMNALEGYSVFWCQELMSVVLRARPNARVSGFDRALAEAVDQCMDASVQALILDLREAPDIDRPTTTEELGLEEFGRRVLVVHPDFGKDVHHDEAHLYGFATFSQATSWARAQFEIQRARAQDASVALATSKEVKLVAANYVAAVYWLSKTHTLAVIYSGQALEDQAAAALLMAVSEYLKHLRARSVIIDLRHRINVERGWLGELSTAVTYLQSRGAERFIIVGSPRARESADDPVQAYLELLSHSSVRASSVKTFEEALSKVGKPRASRKVVN